MRAYIKSTSSISAQPTFDKANYLKDWINPEGQYLHASEPPYRELIDPKLSRRMSRIIKMGVASATQALSEAGLKIPDAIIVGTGLGCIDDTAKFLKDIVESDEGILSPTAFIQSTHNTVAGQIALLIQCPNYNFTYTNRGHSFENSLVDACLQLTDGKKDVLVGAAEEMTQEVYEIMQNMDCVGDVNKKEGPFLGEGASFFVLSNEHQIGRPYLQDIATFHSIELNSLEEQLVTFLNKNNLEYDDVGALLLGNNEFEEDKYYKKIEALFTKESAIISFKKICGEHFTASGFAMHLGTMMLQRAALFEGTILSNSVKKSMKNILIYNHYKAQNHSLILLSI